jgi:hypothetical protein
MLNVYETVNLLLATILILFVGNRNQHNHTLYSVQLVEMDIENYFEK